MKNNTQSFYNEGLLQINRLNYLWENANNASRSGDLVSWRWVLDTVWRELSRDVLKEEEKKKDVTLTPDNKWYNQSPLYKMYEYHKNKLAKEKVHPAHYYSALSDYEIFLRWLQDKTGKGGRYIDPDEHGID